MGGVPLLDDLCPHAADPGVQVPDRYGAGMSDRSSVISLIVVPEWTLRLAIPLNSSMTADSIRYHDPSAIAGAFDLAQTTKRIAPDSSAMIPLCAIEGEAGLGEAHDFAFDGHPLAGNALCDLLLFRPATFSPGRTASGTRYGKVVLLCEFVCYAAFRLGGLDTEFIDEPAELALDLLWIGSLAAFCKFSGDSFCCFGIIHFHTSPTIIQKFW